LSDALKPAKTTPRSMFAEIRDHSETAAVDPFHSSGRSTMALLDELVASAAIVQRGP
jgi:hypothetical protein